MHSARRLISILAIGLLAPGLLPRPALGIDWPEACQRARDTLRQAEGITIDTRVEIGRPVVDGAALLARPVGTDTFGFYDRQRDVLVVDPDVCRCQLFARMDTTGECRDAAFVLVLHELIHAYQAQQIQHRTAPLPSERWLRFLCEGHAIELSRRIALRYGVPAATIAKVYPTAPQGSPPDLAQRRAAVLFAFDYELSARYVARKCATLDGFAALLDQDMSYAAVLAVAAPVEIAGPEVPKVQHSQSEVAGDVDRDQVQGGSRARDDSGEAAMRAAIGKVNSARPVGQEASANALASIPAEIKLDYLDAMVYVCPAAFFQPRTAASFREASLLNTHAADGALLEACIVRLSSPQAAHALWEQACIQHRAWAGGASEPRQPTDVPEINGGTCLCPGWPAKDRTLCLVQRGPYLILGDGRDRRAASAFIDGWLRKALNAESTP